MFTKLDAYKFTYKIIKRVKSFNDVKEAESAIKFFRHTYCRYKICDSFYLQLQTKLKNKVEELKGPISGV